MFERKTPKVPDDSKPPRLEPHEVLGLLFSFVWFHKHVLLALAAIWGLYQFLTIASDQVADSQKRDAGVASVTFNDTTDENLDTREVETRPAMDDVGEFGNIDPDPVAGRSPRKAASLSESPASARFRRFVETADVVSLMKRLKSLNQDLTRVTPTDALTGISRRRLICRQLRVMKLTDLQQTDLEVAELELLSQLDAINVQHNLGIDNTREELLQFVSGILEHPKPIVSTRAHLAIIAAAGVDVAIDPTRPEMNRLKDVYHEHIDFVIHGRAETAVVANLLLSIIKQHQLTEAIALRDDLVHRAMQHSSPELRAMAASIRERIIFEDLELGNLIHRMDVIDQTTMLDIQQFVERLEQNPNSRLSIYKLACAIVEKFLRKGQIDRANEMLHRLNQLLSRIEQPDTRQQVGVLLVELKKKVQASGS